MSMNNWTDEELTSTLKKLEAWRIQYRGTGWGPRLWLITALLGAFAISTGVAFMFLDGVTALSLILILLGSITCFSWYQSEKRKKVNITYIEDITKELKRRKRQKAKSEKEARKKGEGKKTSDKKQAVQKASDNKEEEVTKADDVSDNKEIKADASGKE